jgi:probable F420-dependent oxidoreductase
VPRIKIGVQVQPQHADFDRMRDAWREADEMGVDSIFCWDHFYPLSGEAEGKHFEALTTLASMAEVTENAQIGALVICNSYRNPELLADAHRTIDHISGGRCILGIGAGWFEKDYDEYGYEFGTKASRLKELSAALPRIKARLAKLNPPPIGDIPILIGGGGPKVTLKLVAQYGDAWHSFGDLETYKQKDEILRRHCADIGRDPSEIERTWGARDLDDNGREALAEAGVTHFIIGTGGDGHGYDLSELRDLVRWRDARDRATAA